MLHWGRDLFSDLRNVLEFNSTNLLDYLGGMAVRSELLAEEPFYFKSYDRVIGVARTVSELERELARLTAENLTALQYHLSEGHIVSWLEHSNEKKLAEQLNGVKSVGEAQTIISKYLESKLGATPNVSVHSRRGRPKKGTQ